MGKIVPEGNTYKQLRDLFMDTTRSQGSHKRVEVVDYMPEGRFYHNIHIFLFLDCEINVCPSPHKGQERYKKPIKF